MTQSVLKRTHSSRYFTFCLDMPSVLYISIDIESIILCC
uniref:Uncharacterized protein n=1 Tax=Rhizophora mucronata TaxID=61149 RepID=A0A2P2QSL6_RHIMU